MGKNIVVQLSEQEIELLIKALIIAGNHYHEQYDNKRCQAVDSLHDKINYQVKGI